MHLQNYVKVFLTSRRWYQSFQKWNSSDHSWQMSFLTADVLIFNDTTAHRTMVSVCFALCHFCSKHVLNTLWLASGICQIKKPKFMHCSVWRLTHKPLCAEAEQAWCCSVVATFNKEIKNVFFSVIYHSSRCLFFFFSFRKDNIFSYLIEESYL